MSTLYNVVVRSVSLQWADSPAEAHAVAARGLPPALEVLPFEADDVFVSEPVLECGWSGREITTAAAARDEAIEWQSWVSEQDLSYGELARWEFYFTNIAARFGLIDEFVENGIIGALPTTGPST